SLRPFLDRQAAQAQSQLGSDADRRGFTRASDLGQIQNALTARRTPPRSIANDPFDEPPPIPAAAQRIRSERAGIRAAGVLGSAVAAVALDNAPPATPAAEGSSRGMVQVLGDTHGD